MKEAFIENEDIHTKTAKEVFGHSDITSEERRRAKAVNFGIVYGKSDFGLSEDLNIPVKQAKEYIETLHGPVRCRYSKKGCKLMDELNEKNSWHLQHAENGGEFFVDGYWVDGYDEQNNIVFEYDEPKHYKDEKTVYNHSAPCCILSNSSKNPFRS